jgi:uridine phosphorylase
MVFRHLGHHALSLNAIIANRALQRHSADPYRNRRQTIAYTLDGVATN